MSIRATILKRRILGVFVPLILFAWHGDAASATVRTSVAEGGSQLVYRSGGEFEIVWRAVAPSSEVVFRVYRGETASDMELFYEVSATPGESAYSVDDLPHGSSQIYELRIAKRVDAENREVTLGTLEVLIVELQGKEASLELRARSLADLRLVRDREPQGAAAGVPGPSEIRPLSYWHDPPVPPPRQAI